AAFYERAVQLDPSFAIAWARLSRADASLESHSGIAARRDLSERALQSAQKLQPNSPETLLALGYYQYWVQQDYGSAKTTFGGVSKMLSSNNDVLEALAAVAAKQGNWRESLAYLEQAIALDPRNAELFVHAGQTYGVLRQFPAALKLYDRALDITPNDADVIAAEAEIYQAQGNLPEADRLLSEINEQMSGGSTLS